MEVKAQMNKIKMKKIELSEIAEALEGKHVLCELNEKENKEQERKLKGLEKEKTRSNSEIHQVESRAGKETGS